MFCGECGAQNPDTNQFCRNCGKPLGRRQPAAQPATPPSVQPAPVPAVSYPPPAAAAGPAPAPVPGTVPKRQWNWLGIVSIPLGLLSWGILPLLFAFSAIIMGTAGLILFRRATGRIGISSIIGIVLGLGAIVVLIVLA